MARSLGTGSVSSLLRSAASAQATQQTYTDASAAYQYNLSAKTDADWQEYQAYLGGRAAKTTDPSKQLALQKTLDTARNQFHSAEITRVNTAINYGSADLTTKRNLILNQRNEALSYGDNDLAQSLEQQYTGIDKQIQTEAQAAADKATSENAAAAKKALGGFDTPVAKQTSDQLGTFDEAEKALKAKFAAGNLTATQFAAGQSQLNINRADTFKTLDDKQGGLSELDQQKLYDKYSTFVNGDSYKQYNAKTAGLLGAQNGAGQSQSIQPFATERTDVGNGQTINSIKALKQTGTDAQGLPTYETGRSGDSKFIRNVRNPNGTVGAQVDPMFNVPGADNKGYSYVNDQQGKRFVGKTTTLPSGRQGEFTAKSLDDLKSLEATPNYGTVAGGAYQGAADFVNGASNLLKSAGGKVAGFLRGGGKIAPSNKNPQAALNPNVSGILARSAGVAQQRQTAAVAAAQANAALMAQRQQQLQVLPQFQAPAFKAAQAIVAPQPKAATAKLSFAPLPGQPGYVNAVDTTKQVIANPKSTVTQAINALIGFK